MWPYVAMPNFLLVRGGDSYEHILNNLNEIRFRDVFSLLPFCYVSGRTVLHREPEVQLVLRRLAVVVGAVTV